MWTHAVLDLTWLMNAILVRHSMDGTMVMVKETFQSPPDPSTDQLQDQNLTTKSHSTPTTYALHSVSGTVEVLNHGIQIFHITTTHTSGIHTYLPFTMKYEELTKMGDGWVTMNGES